MRTLRSPLAPSTSGVASLAPRVAPAAGLRHAHWLAASDAGKDDCCSTSTSAASQHGVMLVSRRSLMLASVGAALLAPWLQAGQARADSGALLPWVYVPPPEPVRFPRKPLDQVFAVLLMRSSYDVAEELNFVPMMTFQKEFWLLRASEQEGYNLAYSPLKPRIGDLTDPLYFDFITFSQFATLSREMAAARDATLPAAFTRAVGDRIYDGLRNGFREQQFGAPPPLPPSPQPDVRQVVGQVQALMDVMVDRGLALKAEVVALDTTPAASSPAAAAAAGAGPGSSVGQVAGLEGRPAQGPRQFRVTLQGPASLWSMQSLRSRRSPLLNSYAAMAIDGYLRASGIDGSSDISLSDTTEVQLWTLA